jgi:hypothetical protein
MSTLEVSRFIRVPRQVVHSVLRDIHGHHRLADDAIQLVGTDDGPPLPRGIVRVSPPLPLTWTVRTEMTRRDDPARVTGIAQVDGRTAADIEWRLESRADGTLVHLRATMRDLTVLERALLRLGGARWLRRRFRQTLGRLERVALRSA